MCFFVFKQKTAYEVRMSDWSSDVCSSDLGTTTKATPRSIRPGSCRWGRYGRTEASPVRSGLRGGTSSARMAPPGTLVLQRALHHFTTSAPAPPSARPSAAARSAEHTSELQSLMRISYAVFCLKKKTKTQRQHT